MGRHRQADRHLAVVLLAQLAAILPRHADRVAALLGKAGVVDDPRLDRFVTRDGWQDTFAHTAQHRLIGPRRLGHKVQQRLVLRRGSLRRGHCRQWFDALAALRRQQPNTVVRERPHTVGVSQHRCQTCCVPPRNALACRFHRQDPPHPPRTVGISTHNESHSRRSKRKLPVGLVILQLSRRAPTSVPSCAESGSVCSTQPTPVRPSH